MEGSRGIDSILLVDDNRGTNFFNSSLLKRFGYKGQISMVSNVKKALDHISDFNIPDIIFLDINMPVMNGIEFLKAFKDLSKERSKNTLVVILTGVELTDDYKSQIEEAERTKIVYSKMLSSSVIYDVFLDYSTGSPQGNDLFQTYKLRP